MTPFGKLTLFGVMLLFVSAFVVPAYAQTSMPEDARIKLLKYDQNDIYTIYTLYGYQTNIEFGRDETIQTISVGDRSLWQIVPSNRRMFIRPLDDNMTTNMTVITDRRTYQFDLKSGEGELSNNPRMVYVARFVYPERVVLKAPVIASGSGPLPAAYVPSPSPSVAARPYVAPTPNPTLTAKPMVTLPPAAPIKTVELQREFPVPPPPPPPSQHSMEAARDIARNASETALQSNTQFNYNYTYTGPDSLAPTQLYDDGSNTFIKLANATKPAPKMYVIEGDVRRAITPRFKDGIAIAPTVSSYLLLDYGRGENNLVYLYNEERMPAGL